MFFIKRKNNNHNRGFTLIEMLVAVFIFTVSLSVLMTISARGLKAARLAQKQVVADYLALEGIELVRNLRDSAFLVGRNENTWKSVFNKDGCLDALEGNTASSCAFELGQQGAELYPCTNTADCALYISDDGIYTSFRNGPPDGYRSVDYQRLITLQQIGAIDSEVVVRSEVIWPTGSVQYVDNLFLWL